MKLPPVTIREDFPELTTREYEVLVEFLKGKQNKAIGHALGLTERSIKNYSSLLRAKLNCRLHPVLVVYLVLERVFRREAAEASSRDLQDRLFRDATLRDALRLERR